MEDDGLCIEGEGERILALLSVVSPVVLGRLRRASKHWRNGGKSLAAIHLARSGLGKLDAVNAYRLSLAAKLIEAGVTPRELASELGCASRRSRQIRSGPAARASGKRPRKRPVDFGGCGCGRRRLDADRGKIGGYRSRQSPSRAQASQGCDYGQAAGWMNNLRCGFRNQTVHGSVAGKFSGGLCGRREDRKLAVCG
ncbi:MAG TPA: hypothetical protein VHT48_02735 [Methylocella sp.]|nr:hypothetical protein [Methylocella sp.]